MSPASRNWVFGTMYFDYNLHPNDHYVRHLFFSVEKTAGPILDGDGVRGGRWRW